MTLLAEYALTPGVFDATSYSSDEVCGLHLQALKEVLLHEGLVRNLHDGAWANYFDVTARPWHRWGKELLKKLRTQRRLTPARATQVHTPSNDAEWCTEALGSNAQFPLSGIVTTDATAAAHRSTAIVSSVSQLRNAAWWSARSASILLKRSLAEYQRVLGPLLRHANSLLLIDPYINPSDVYQYGDLIALLRPLGSRSVKPLVELHRAAWYGSGGRDKRPRVNDVIAALQPALSTLAQQAGLTFDVFLWDDIHDRYLVTDLIGINLSYGFATTRTPDAYTTWHRLGRNDRDAIQRRYDPAYRTPRHRFSIP